MLEISRRNFLKTSAIAAFALGSLEASVLELPKSKGRFSYFIKDSQINTNETFKADKVLEVNGDISDIYAELKEAFKSQSLIASLSSETTFFVLSTMAASYGMRVAHKQREGNICAWILAPKGVKL